MSTQETATPVQRATKRVRTDESTETLIVQGIEAPSQAAANTVVQAVESRQEDVRTLFKKLSSEFVTLKTKQRQLDSTRSRMAEEDVIPRSCRFKFELKAADFVMESPRFMTIVEATKQDMLQYQKKLKQRIVECLDLEIKMTKEKICKLFLCAIYQLATLERIERNPKTDPDNNDVLKICAFAVKSKLNNSVFQFISSDPLRVLFTSHFVKQIKGENGNLLITSEMTTQEVHDLWNPTSRESTIFTIACDKLNKDLKTIFVQSWKAYQDRLLASEKDRALARKVKEFTTTQSTETTAMAIDAEPTVEPKRMKEIVNNLVEKNLKEIKKELSQLRQSTSKTIKTKNTDGGARNNSASIKKKTTTDATKKQQNTSKGDKQHRQDNKRNGSADVNANDSHKGKQNKKRDNNSNSGRQKSGQSRSKKRSNSTKSKKS